MAHKTQKYKGLICPQCNFVVDQDTGYCMECGCEGITEDDYTEEELNFTDEPVSHEETYIKEVDRDD